MKIKHLYSSHLGENDHINEEQTKSNKNKRAKARRPFLRVSMITSGSLHLIDDSILLDCEQKLRNPTGNRSQQYEDKAMECSFQATGMDESLCETASESTGTSLGSDSICSVDSLDGTSSSPTSRPAPLSNGCDASATSAIESTNVEDEVSPPPLLFSKSPPPTGFTSELAMELIMKRVAIMQKYKLDYEKKLITKCQFQDGEELEYVFRCTPAQLSSKVYASLKNIASSLTEEEKDISADADYTYYRITKRREHLGLPLETDEILKIREDAILAQIERYLVQYKGKEKVTLEEYKKSLEFRKTFSINMARFCFTDIPTHTFSKFAQHICRRYIGNNPRAVVLNYDELGHANLFLKGRFNTWETRSDLEGFLSSHGYMFERAIAATQTRSKGKLNQVNCVLDFADFDKKKNSQPMFMLLELLKLLKQQYPQRVYRCYMVDPPFIARFVYKIVKPFVMAANLCKEVVFVNGEKERRLHFGPTMGDQNFSEDIDMEKFYATPFHKTYFDS